jgi:hypothetical protein
MLPNKPTTWLVSNSPSLYRTKWDSIGGRCAFDDGSTPRPVLPVRFYTWGMAMVIPLPDEAAARVSAAAAARGVSVVEIVEELTTTLPASAPTAPRRHLALAGIGATEHGITTRTDDDLATGFGQD